MSAVTGGSSNYSSLAPTKAVFDISSEADVLQLLRTIHQSTLAVEDKNELRDFVFTYRLNKAIVDITALQAHFSKFGFAVVDDNVNSTETNTVPEVAAPSPATPSNRIGHQRKAPSFHTPKPSPVPRESSTPQQAPTEAVAGQASPVKAVTTPEVKPDIEPAHEPGTTANTAEVPNAAPVDAAVNKVTIKKVRDTNTSTTETRASAATATPEDPVTANVHEPASTADTNTATQAPVAESVPETTAPTTTEPASPATLSPAERIKEIKHEINLKVGNPIALIDIDNTVGREYMAALLDAMKQTSVEDSSAASERAMSRLEKAYQAVKELLAREDAGQQEESKPTDDTSAVAVPPAPKVLEPEHGESTPSNAPKVSAAKATTPVEMTKTNSDTRATAKRETTETAAPIASIADEQVSNSEPVQAVANEEVVETTQASSSAPMPKAVPTASAHSISSPANDKRVGTVLAEQEAARKAEKPQDVKDPLMQEKVTRGLEQLLSEWSIFKRSGMFGTGPNGIEHPLYETLDQLTMSTVLTGRFEGVTPEVKRSINDYMNGWRYEEGIVHESGETFEHYLRRVVHHILEKRTKSVDASA